MLDCCFSQRTRATHTRLASRNTLRHCGLPETPDRIVARLVLFDPGEVQTCFDVCGGRNRRYCCVLPALNSTAPFNGIVSFKLAALVRSGRTLRVCRGISTITLTPNTGHPVPDHAWRNCIKLAGSNIVLERRGSLVHCGLAWWGPNSSSVGDCL